MKAVCLLAMSVIPVAFAAENLRIDHATVAGASLDSMRKALLDATGIQAEYGGPHSNHATEMALVSFPDGSYLELMGIQKQADPVAVSMHVWSRFLEGDGGPCAFALRVSDIDAEVRQLRDAGIEAGATEKSGRTRPDGVKLAWETVNVGPGNRGSLFPFLIRDETPRENRVYPTGKPTTERFEGVAKVVIGVHDLNAAIAQYRKAFHLPAPRRMRDDRLGANLAWFENTPVMLAQGVGDDSWLSRRVREYGDAPCGFILKPKETTNVSGPQTVSWLNESSLGWRLGIQHN
jgi:hypothetical protein